MWWGIMDSTGPGTVPGTVSKWDIRGTLPKRALSGLQDDISKAMTTNSSTSVESLLMVRPEMQQSLVHGAVQKSNHCLLVSKCRFTKCQLELRSEMEGKPAWRHGQPEMSCIGASDNERRERPRAETLHPLTDAENEVQERTAHCVRVPVSSSQKIPLITDVFAPVIPRGQGMLTCSLKLRSHLTVTKAE